ncbi:MFS transporter [Haloechinothrix alba]|nr:MFS transporter [Haloechinothrix alba]
MSRSGKARALAGAVLLDLAVSPLFIWDTFTSRLAAELGASDTALSVVIAVGLALFTVGVLAGGRIADRVAPRGLALLSAAGVVAGLAVSAAASSVPVLVLGFGVLLGAATGTGYATAVRVATTVPTRRGMAVALVVSAYAAGAVVLAPVADRLLVMVGRAGTFAALAAVLGVTLILAAVLLPGSTPDARTAPEASGPAVRHQAAIPALWALFALGCAPALVAFAHAGRFAGGPELAAIAVALLNAGNFVGRLVAGPACDRVGTTRALHATAAALVGACLVLALSHHPWLSLAALLVLGAQYGALSVLTPLTTASAVPPARFGTAYGIVFSGWGVVGLTGPVAAAWLAGNTGYRPVAAALSVVGVLAWLATAWTLSAVRRATPAHE